MKTLSSYEVKRVLRSWLVPWRAQCGHSVVLALYDIICFPARESRPLRRRAWGAGSTLVRRLTPGVTGPRSPGVSRSAVARTTDHSGQGTDWRRSPLISPHWRNLRAAVKNSCWGRRLAASLPAPTPMSRWVLWPLLRAQIRSQRLRLFQLNELWINIELDNSCITMLMLQTMFMYKTVSRKSVRYHTLSLPNRSVKTGVKRYKKLKQKTAPG